MHNLSLRLRSFAAALLVLVVFIPLAAFTLESAFTSSLSQSMQQQLRVQSLTLISEFEMSGDEPVMPEQLFNDQLNIPGSGLYAFIKLDERMVWRSLSTLNWQAMPEFSAPDVGKERFDEDYSLLEPYFLFAYTAEFDSGGEFVPVSFYILQDKSAYNVQEQAFITTLWRWLSLIALVLLGLLIVSLNAALWPINRLIKQIKQAEAGHIKHISQTYPPELEKLKRSINHLLATEQQQRSRYKNSLSDLAHGLKTPLAVLSGNTALPDDAREPINQIDVQIQRQLKRAVAGSNTAWEQAVEIAPVLSKIVNAMNKVHAHKQLDIEQVNATTPAPFYGDSTDLMELLGNVLDNACKAAAHKVRVDVVAHEKFVQIDVEDDGPGIPKEKRQLLLTRGTRLDSYKEGQGIGMAVVADLVDAYQGTLIIEDSELGGARISVRFPTKHHI
ncbi:GHKL domain-containing protein [Paraglaciecola agarilytica]|uniref:ATP-binding protein n=1 Tax=Paraglaciecola chathamensis TaxID=368405 RepID=UPI001C087862|nr:ATP-binding protein [Paraglaciecola agarilytica]MBU3016906.1 GHKL domain-containing protein [Paraglaciecola agarilytica]